MELYPSNATTATLQAATDQELMEAATRAASIVESDTSRRVFYTDILQAAGPNLAPATRAFVENMLADINATVQRWQGLGLKCENEQRSRVMAAQVSAAANWHTLNEAAGLAQRRGDVEVATKLRLMASEIAEQNDVDPFRDE